MRPEEDLESRVERLLKDGAPAMPERLRASVREQVARKSQRGRGFLDLEIGWARRWSGAAQLLAAAAFLVLVVVGAIAVGGHPEATPTPTAESPAPSPTAGGPAPTPETPAASPTSSAEGPFSGTWSTIDLDGSVILAVFEGTGPDRRVTITDLRATYCGGHSHVDEGTGTVDGTVLVVKSSGGCLGSPLDQPSELPWTYDAASGTLRTPFDSPGFTELIWVRGTLTDAFDGTWTATDVDGSSLILRFTGSGLNRSVSLTDTAAADCGGGSLTAGGTATIGTVVNDGRFIAVSFHATCAAGGNPRDYVKKYEFVLAEGTLLGPLTPLEIGGTPRPDTVTWSRP